MPQKSKSTFDIVNRQNVQQHYQGVDEKFYQEIEPRFILKLRANQHLPVTYGAVDNIVFLKDVPSGIGGQGTSSSSSQPSQSDKPLSNTVYIKRIDADKLMSVELTSGDSSEKKNMDLDAFKDECASKLNLIKSSIRVYDANGSKLILSDANFQSSVDHCKQRGTSAVFLCDGLAVDADISGTGDSGVSNIQGTSSETTADSSKMVAVTVEHVESPQCLRTRIDADMALNECKHEAPVKESPSINGRPVLVPDLPTTVNIDNGNSLAAASATATKKMGRDLDPPRYYWSAFVFFSNEKRASVVAENPGATFGEIGQKIGAMWSAASPFEKAPYQAMALKDKERFNMENAEYMASKYDGNGDDEEEKDEKEL
ncbi:Non-histone chromosomal protein 6 [Blyttiomyces sp. JEL0837]|nr:Non-histone chromosomal protein 6 [Blyttiomyces sp. JEL0837]